MRNFWGNLRTLLAVLSTCALVACGGSSDSGVRLTSSGASQGGAQELSDTFAATLTAAEQVPASTSSAQGAGTVVVNPLSRQMVAVVTTSGVVATAVNIRQAASGAVGPIVIPLTETPAGSGVWTATVALSDAQLDALRAGQFYFELASTNFPQGELRGQIAPQLPGLAAGVPLDGGTSGIGSTASGAAGGVPAPGFGTGASAPVTFVAALRGAQVVPPSPSLAQGSGTVTVNPATRQIAAAVATAGVAPTSVSIRQGAPGVNGDVVLALAETGEGSGVWLTRAMLTETAFNALVAGNLYLNVHSAAFPEGELRGQLVPQQRAAAGLAATPPPSGSVPAADAPTFGTVDPGFGTGAAGVGTPGGFGAAPPSPADITGVGTPSIGASFPGPSTIDPIGTTGFGAAGIGMPSTPGIGLPSTPGIGALDDTPGFGTTTPAGTGFGTTGTTGIGTTGTIGTTALLPGSSLDGTSGFGTSPLDLPSTTAPEPLRSTTGTFSVF